MKNNYKKILVIGGSGFMGSHTADELSNRGFDVSIFDCVESPYIRPDQQMIVGDILDKKAIENAVKDAKYVYYFAGIADIGEARSKSYHTINMNVMGATVALEATIKAKIDRFIYASTMYVYSSHGSFYRASKQAAEIVIKAYADSHKLNYTLLRYGSLYGPRSQSWNGLHRYVEQVVQEGRLDYIGTGKERREYIHVKDAARLSVDIIDNSYKNRAVTITGNQVLDSEVLIKMIFEISGTKYDVNFIKENIPGDHYEITPYRFNPERAMKIVPREFVDIGEGILDLIEDIYRQHNSK